MDFHTLLVQVHVLCTVYRKYFLHKRMPSPPTHKSENNLNRGIFLKYFLNVYFNHAAPLHLSPLRFLCVGGCLDRTQDSCGLSMAVRRSIHSTRSHPSSNSLLGSPIVRIPNLYNQNLSLCVYQLTEVCPRAKGGDAGYSCVYYSLVVSLQKPGTF
jgi:hypothetical protein